MESFIAAPENSDWVAQYSSYLLQNMSALQGFSPDQRQRANVLLQQLLHASQQGNSAIDCMWTDIADLVPMVQRVDPTALDALSSSLANRLSQTSANISSSSESSESLSSTPSEIAPNTFDGANVVAPCIFFEQQLALYRYWQLELRLSQQVLRLSQQAVPQVDVALAGTLLTDPHQQLAAACVSQQAFSMITGGPGTGKTYTLSRIIALLQHGLGHLRVAMAAPTGKAAQRMQEALQSALNAPELQATGWITPALSQQRTQTIHRLLGMGNQQKPRYHAKQPLPYDVIVIDEASMLDLSLATALFEAVAPQARLILLGDPQQLASVDVGAVLADLQACAALQPHRVHLQQSRRFHADAAIGRCAAFIYASTLPNTSAAAMCQAFFDQVGLPVAREHMRELLPHEQDRVQCCQLSATDATQQALDYQALLQGFVPYLQALQAYQNAMNSAAQTQDVSQTTTHLAAVVQAFDDYRLLTGVKHGIWGIQQLNRMVAQWLQQQLKLSTPQPFYLGRSVMMTYNDYNLGLSNGDIGLCLSRLRPDEQGQIRPHVDVYFPSLQQWFAAARLPQNMQDAFALTIHKSQGSEFRHCAVVLAQDAEKILSRELFYTAVSRAKRVVSIWFEPAALATALQRETSRNSGLLTKLNLMSKS